MTIDELWRDYLVNTKVVSELARKLGFGAAAICWIFRDPNKASILPLLIQFALLVVVFYFVCDMLQFFVSAILLGWWTRREERRRDSVGGPVEEDCEKPAWLDSPGRVLWATKVLLLFVAYALIAWHLLWPNGD